MQTRNTITPWYKQYWPWILIALPLSAVIASFTSLYFALHQPDSLVVDDYYKDGLGINRTLQHERRAFDLKLSATGEIELDKKLILLRLKGEQQPPVLQISLLHPTQSQQDRQVQLARQPDGRYLGTLTELPAADWYVRLEPKDDTWRLNGRVNWPHEKQWQLIAARP